MFLNEMIYHILYEYMHRVINVDFEKKKKIIFILYYIIITSWL